CGDRALSDLPLDHASSRNRQGLLAWVYGFRRAAVAARPGMDEGERLAATHNPAPDPRAWPTALACLRGSVDRCLAEHRVEQRPQRRHDALLSADDGTADGRGAKRWSKTVGSFGADRKSTRLNSSHVAISYAVFCLKKKNNGNCHRGSLRDGSQSITTRVA